MVRSGALRSSFGRPLVAGVGLSTVVALLLVSVAAAQEQDVESRIRAQVQSGEFSAAVDAAGQLPRERRDAALGNIAAAQQRVGAGQASLATVATIRDDQLRGNVLGQMFGGGGNQFFGGGAGMGTGMAGMGGGPNTTGGAPMINGGGGMGGGVRPDFESLIELMSSTIAPETWREAGGTQGEVKSHRGGVYVDADGAMRPIVNAAELAGMAKLRREAAGIGAATALRSSSGLRKISLTRLERELQIRSAQGQAPDEAMQTLAGLQKIQYIFVYPETGDVVLAGPAGDWYLGRENRLLAVDTDRPVVLLDDLIALLRREFSRGGEFGCSIDPTPEGIQRLTAFVNESNKKPLSPGTRGKWTAELGTQLGLQKITIDGIDPASHAAQVLVEADYRMKLLGVGKEESIPQVPSYLQLLNANKGQPPALDLVRWWFTVNYEALLTSTEHDVYELRGQGVRLLSENEFLAAQGTRVASGKADAANQEFASRFTSNFVTLAQKYPIYAELQNLFDLALVCSVLKNDGVCDRIGWHRSGFMNSKVYETEQRAVPTRVETVANSRELTKTLIVATASGGVTVDVGMTSKPTSMQVDGRGQLYKVRRSEQPEQLPPRGWWWD